MISGDIVAVLQRRRQAAMFERARLAAGIPAPIPEPQRSEMIQLWTDEGRRLAARLLSLGVRA